VFVGPVKGFFFSEVGYHLRQMFKANRPGQSSCSGIWCFSFLIPSVVSVILLSFYILPYLPLLRFRFPFLFSAVLFLWFSPLHNNIPPLWSQHRFTFFPNNANNSSMKSVMFYRPNDIGITTVFRPRRLNVLFYVFF